jgi:protocatechuate 3,4-dioxygenase beta subunit
MQHGEPVRGRTVDERGQPLGGVEIADAQGTLASSDAHGEFVVPHVSGEVKITAQKPGYLPVSKSISPSTHDAGDLQLQRAEGRLGGVVVDDRGTPVAGARVDVTAAIVPPKRLLTDARGHFRADGLGPGPYKVEVAQGDFAPARLTQVAPADDLTVTLSPGAGLDGTIRDGRTGEVPRGLKLDLVTPDRTVPLGVDRRGHFESFALPAGKATLRASAPGYVPLDRAIELVAGDRPREITLRDIDLTLDRGGTIAGSVLDSDGNPVPNAAVSAGAAHGRTDGRGDFSLEGVAPGRVGVHADAGGRHAVEEVDVRSGEDSRVELRLR